MLLPSALPITRPHFPPHDRERTGPNRKTSIRDSYIRKLKKQGTRFAWNGKREGGRELKRKPLKKVSRALRGRFKVYFALTTAFLLRPENSLCEICKVRREHSENIQINCATEIHHHRGRLGRLLCWVPGFRPSCYGCRNWPHDNKKQAREWGLLAPTTIYDVFPV